MNDNLAPRSLQDDMNAPGVEDVPSTTPSVVLSFVMMGKESEGPRMLALLMPGTPAYNHFKNYMQSEDAEHGNSFGDYLVLNRLDVNVQPK